MTEKTKLVRINFKSWETLQNLSLLSDRDMNALIEEWLKSCQLVLDSYGSDFSRISLMSAFYEKDRLAISYIAPIYTGSFKIPECLKESTKEILSEKIMKRELEEKRRKKA